MIKLTSIADTTDSGRELKRRKGEMSAKVCSLNSHVDKSMHRV